ncbi:MAG TPA: response regulator transcription factor, partial [Nitrospiraceae bacterium]|nr:response regulator transcription factor [Nitrospiraceae bacterium]
RVLLVEDEHKISAYVKRGLEEYGYAVDAVFTGRDALDWAEAAPYDLIVLDIMLPNIDGLTVCRELRQRGDRTPVLMLTARDAVDDSVIGLDAGADDYLVKPFAMKELLARLRALARRVGEQPKSPVLSFADLSLDTRTHQVRRNGRLIPLAIKEFSVLECLLREPEHALTRTQIAEHVWNYDTFNQSNVVDVYIRNLRRKVDDPFEKKLIHTVRGVGYRLSLNEMD